MPHLSFAAIRTKQTEVGPHLLSQERTIGVQTLLCSNMRLNQLSDIFDFIRDGGLLSSGG